MLSRNPLEPSRHKKIHVARPGHPGTVTMLEMVEHLRGLSGGEATVELKEFLLDVSNRTWSPHDVVNLRPLAGEVVREAG